jgi:hypothetical protein
MLQKLSKQAAECSRLARNAKEKAERTPDEAIRRDYLALERRWVKLAQSYELSERVSSFNSEVGRRIAVFQPRTPPHPGAAKRRLSGVRKDHAACPNRAVTEWTRSGYHAAMCLRSLPNAAIRRRSLGAAPLSSLYLRVLSWT